MPQENTVRNNNFDLIRLIAAAQVVFIHAVGHTPVLDSSPWWLARLLDWVILFPGVATFFVISGYLIPQSYERLKDQPKTYFMRRIRRIYPALLVCLAVSLILLGLFGFLTKDVLSSPLFWSWLLGQVTVGQFYNLEAFRGFGVGAVNGALWTISVEIQYYLVVPLVHLLRRNQRVGDALLVLTFIMSFAAFIYVDATINSPAGFSNAPITAKLLYVSLLPHWWMFVLGMVLQRYKDLWSRFLDGCFIPYFAAYTVVALAREMVIGRHDSWAFVFYLGYLPERILLALMTVSAAFTCRNFSSYMLRGVDISYGVYIYHFLVINVLVHLGWMDSPGAVVVVFLVTIAAGAASWFGIEKRALSDNRGAGVGGAGVLPARNGTSEPAV